MQSIKKKILLLSLIILFSVIFLHMNNAQKDESKYSENSVGSALYAGTRASRPHYSVDKVNQLAQQNCKALQKIAMEAQVLCGKKLIILKQNYRADASIKQIAFTFDLGSNLGQLPRILSNLKKHQVKSTFFITGDFIKRYPDWTRKIVAEGHEVANHTFHHIRFKNPAQLYRELIRTEAIFYRITGKYLAPYFRSPFFQEDSRDKQWIIQSAASFGYRHFNATIDPMDWTNVGHPCYITIPDFIATFQRLQMQKHNKYIQFRLCKKGVQRIKKLSPEVFDLRGAIVLLHAGSPRKNDILTDALPQIFSYLHSKNYHAVTLTKLFQR